MKCKPSFTQITSKLKVLLPLIFLYLFCFLQIVLCDKNSPSLIYSHKNLLSTKNDLLFVSTRDGLLHAFVPSSNSFSPQWTTSLGPELISSNITTTKITDDLLLLPLDDKLFIYENGQFTSLDIFVKDLVEKTPQSFNDFLLIGNKKSTVYVIDKTTGEILQHSDIDNNLVNSYTNVTKANTITVIRIDYILTCLGKEEKFWNAMYSDIIIQKGNSASNIGYLPNKKDIFMELLNSSEIEEKDIITVHSYDNEYNLPVKIYDKNKRKGKTSEIMKSSKYFDFKQEIFEDEDERYRYLQWRENKEKIQLGDIINVFIRDIKIWLDRNLTFTRMILAVVLVLTVRKIMHYIAERGKKKCEELKENHQCVALTKKVDYIQCMWEEYKKRMDEHIENTIQKGRQMIEDSSKQINEKINEGLNSFRSANCSVSKCNDIAVYSPKSCKNETECNLLTEIKKFNGLINDPLALKQYQKERVDQVNLSSYENEDDTVTVEVNHKTKVIYKKNKETEEIHKKIQELNKSMQSESRRNSFPNINYKESNSQLINNQQTFNRKYTEDITQSNNIIFGDDEDESKNKQNISTNDTDSKHKRHNDLFQSQITTESTAPRCRLDKDFTDIIKIGQGGFGVVLKAKHKIDEQIYAIKIIKFNNLSEQDVVTEIKTMLKIRYKHIVEYKTCWFEKNLGSAQRFMINSEASSMITNTLTSKNTDLVVPKINELDENLPKIKEAPSIVFEGDDDDDNDSNFLRSSSKYMTEKKSKKYEYVNIFDDPLSDDEKLSTTKKKIRKPIIDFRDDSNMITSRKSKISRRNLPYVDYNLYFFIQMEFCDGLPLDKYITSHLECGISRKTIYTFTYQILKSLHKIHSNGIIHRDIKPANIFVVGEADDDIKIGDFGLATEISQHMISNNDIVGTPLYLSPEQIGKKLYNEKVDIYASGLVLYEMCACFETLMERRESINMLRSARVVCDKVREGFKKETELILWMTEIKIDKRPSANEVLTSELFKKWKEEIEKG